MYVNDVIIKTVFVRFDLPKVRNKYCRDYNGWEVYGFEARKLQIMISRFKHFTKIFIQLGLRGLEGPRPEDGQNRV